MQKDLFNYFYIFILIIIIILVSNSNFTKQKSIYGYMDTFCK